jgi:hypothetical protein
MGMRSEKGEMVARLAERMSGHAEAIGGQHMGRYLNHGGCRLPIIRSWSFIGTCLALSFLEVACTTIAEREQKYGAPPNYRELIARELLQVQAERSSSFSSATISQSTVSFVGITSGNERPVVCVTTVIEGPLIPTTTRWLYMFEGGQVAARRVNPGAIYCNFQMSPFPEAMKRNG